VLEPLLNIHNGAVFWRRALLRLQDMAINDHIEAERPCAPGTNRSASKMGLVLLAAGACMTPSPQPRPAPGGTPAERVAGCYELSYQWGELAGEWPDFKLISLPPGLHLSPVEARPPGLPLSSANAAGRQAREGEPFRSIKPIPDGFPLAQWWSGWRVLSSGAIEIVSSTGFIGFRMLLRTGGDRLEGTATLFSDVGGPAPEGKVSARRIACENAPP
jgi:hypothetical protein